MSKNTKPVKHNGPGRPKYVPVIPRGKFTFTDLEVTNGVNPNTGKGKNCTTLTLRKWLKRELSNRRHGAVVLVKDTLADPNSKSGLGRKQYVYTHRPNVASAKASTPRKAKAPAADVSQSTQDYEKTKAELLAPTPAVTITPDSTPAPTPEVTPAPTTEPVAETVPVAADPAPAVEAPAETPVTVS